MPKLNYMLVIFIAIALFILFIITQVLGQENLQEEKVAGTAPDSFLWNFDVFFDNLKVFFAFDPGTRAKISLDIAKERLEEFNLMHQKNRIDLSRLAEQEHTRLLEEAKVSLRNIERLDRGRELEEVVELEREIIKHKTRAEDIAVEVKIKTKTGQLTQEQQDLLNATIESILKDADETEVEIVNRKEKTRIRIKTFTGKTDEEIEEEIERLENRTGLKLIKKERAENQIKDAEEALEELKFMLGQINVTTQERLRLNPVFTLANLSEEALMAAKEAFNATKYGEAFGRATAAESHAKSGIEILKRQLEREERDFRIKVEIVCREDNETCISEIKIIVDDRKLRFVLDTTDREDILRVIGKRLNLTREDILKVIEFELEEEGEEGIEVKVEIKDNKAEVEIEIEGREIKLIIDSADREEIVNQISDRTGLSRDAIRKVIRFVFEEPEVDFRACTQDSDCVKVPADCCGCQAGGASIAINKAYLEVWNEKKLGACQGIACIQLYKCADDEPECVENECRLVEKEAEGGRKYISRYPEECSRLKFFCAMGYQPFSDETGCGCEPIEKEDACEELSKFARQNAEQIVLEECRNYYSKSCTNDSDCGSFPCENNECLIKPCTSDSECPTMCGLHATPVPGFCTTVDVI